MAVIGFNEKKGWVVARWVFAQFCRDLRAYSNLSKEADYCIDEALALDGLHLDLTEEPVRSELLIAIENVTDSIVAAPHKSTISRNRDGLNL